MRRGVSHFVLALAIVLTQDRAVSAPLFESDEILRAVLTAPLSQIYEQRSMESPPYLAGTWAYSDAGGALVRLNIQIRTRGNFRRKNCQFPPMQLNFRKSEVKQTLFRGQDKLKLVVPCESTKNYTQYVVLENLAYRMLQTITPFSFDTRLIRLSHNDADQKNRTWTQLTFVIEDEDDMAKRNGMRILKEQAVHSSTLDPAATALVELFQLMIGNTDYSTIRGPEGSDCCHNVKLLKPRDGDGGLIPVPYDFDVSGLINTPYASPASITPISRVRTRYFTGRCKPEPYWWKAIERISEKRDDIYALITSDPELNNSLRKRNLDYMRDYFELIDDPDEVRKLIIGRCRGQIVHDPY